jgi:hypothetical protein
MLGPRAISTPRILKKVVSLEKGKQVSRELIVFCICRTAVSGTPAYIIWTDPLTLSQPPDPSASLFRIRHQLRLRRVFLTVGVTVCGGINIANLILYAEQGLSHGSTRI